MILPMIERKPMFFQLPAKISLDRNVLVLPFLFRISLAHNPLNMFNDRLESGPRSEIARNTLFLQQRLVLVRDNPTAHEQNIVSALLPDELSDLREGSHVSTIEQAHSHNINILINCHLSNLLRRRQKSCVDNFHACVPESTSQDQSASIMTI